MVSQFGFNTTATEVTEKFSKSIKGKTILITGVSPHSLGEALATSVAAHAPERLLLASRTPPKLAEVAAKLRTSYPTVCIFEIPLDLASLKSVREAAARVRAVVGAGCLHFLFNNAGINISKRRVTEDGLEMQFGTNHVGPFLLTNSLMPLLVRAGDGRVVNTSSEAHRISPLRFSEYNIEPGRRVPEDEEPRRGMPAGILRVGGRYEPAIAYGQSKTANILFAVALNARAGETGMKSFAVHPGTIMTDLARGLDESSLKGLVSSTEVWKSTDQGAAKIAVAGFDPEVDETIGVYLDDCQMKRSSKWACDTQKAERLWRLSEELVGEEFNYKRESKL